MYKYYNANALNKLQDDCVVRSVSLATNNTWDNTYEYLSDLAQLNGTLLDNKQFVIDFLDSKFIRLPEFKGSVGEVSYLFPNSTLLISMNGHITCSKSGIVYDTYDCRNRQVEFVWLVP